VLDCRLKQNKFKLVASSIIESVAKNDNVPIANESNRELLKGHIVSQIKRSRGRDNRQQCDKIKLVKNL
jgi:hypothetical protein